MEPSDIAETSIIPTSGRRPSLEELTALDEEWTESRLNQLIAAAEAADRWLADHPEDAGRFFREPATVIAELADAAVLTEPVDDLLAALRSREKGGG